jgi:hypothetical protein
MGLDIIELVMEIEEAFDIVIPDQDGERIRTLGDLYEYILQQTGRRRDGPCLSGFTFYRFRRALVEASGIARQEVNPRSRLEELLPVVSRRYVWEQMRESLGSIPLPSLSRPLWLIRAIMVGAVAFLGFAAAITFGLAGIAVWGGIIAVAIWARLLFETAVVTRTALRLTTPLAVCFPAGYGTVRDVVQDLLAYNYSLIQCEANPGGPVEVGSDDFSVWDAMCYIISQSAGVDRNKLTETTRWQDIGI